MPIFGRDAELALLLQAWEKARSGRGQAVLLTGEAGIGKSRLLQAFAEATAAGLPTRHVFQCSPLHTDNPFWPVVLRFAPAAAIVARGTEDAGGGGRRKVRRNVVVALAAQLLAAAMPALLIFEDAQWADQATLELMRHLAGAVGDAPVLLIVTDRPEAEAHLGTATNLTRLELARLDGPTSVGLITAVAGRCQLAPRLLGDIVARSDGIPLFLEEMTRAVLEAAPAGGEISVPATLRDSLIARLDVAPAMKAVAQIASCVGRDFDEALLSTAGDIGAVELRQGLAALVQAGLVVAQPGTGFRFKHALLCDIAYETLLTPRRQRLHRSIAEALEAMPDNPAEREPELLARHWYAAGENGRAEVYWLRARHCAAHWQEQLDALAHFLESDAAEVVPFPGGGRDRGRLG